MIQIGMFEEPRSRSIPAARKAGERAAKRCVDKATDVAQFNAEAARKTIVGHLARWGNTSGEDLVDACKAVGIRGHDDRCFGPVLKTLARRNMIRCVRSDLPRARGHGTSGGKLWALVR